MPDRGAPVVVFDDTTHGDRRHYPGRYVGTFQGITHRQRVHYRGQHAHVIAGDSLHAGRVQGGTAKQITTADDHANLNAQPHQLTHLDCHSIQYLGIDTEVRIAGEGLATEL